MASIPLRSPAATAGGTPGRIGSAMHDTADDVGDEALLLARTAPTLIARDRGAGARAVEAMPGPASVIVMDDGLQNPSLAKDLAIAMVDGSRGLGNGLVIPAGPLRAPLEFQLGLADAIVVNGAGTGDRVAEWLRHRFNGPVLRSSTVVAGDATWLQGQRVVAWAGIGSPQRFIAMLETQGAEVVERVIFPRSPTSQASRCRASARACAPAPGAPRQHRKGFGTPQGRDRETCRACRCHAGAADQVAALPSPMPSASRP